MPDTGKPVPSGKLLLEVVTPDKLLVSKYVDQISAPGTDGDFGVLPGHCHFLTTLRIGELHYRIGEAEHYMSVLWGFADVTPHKVTILAEIAEKAEDIDVERAQASVAQAEERLERGGLPTPEARARVTHPSRMRPCRTLKRGPRLSFRQAKAPNAWTIF